MRRLLHWLFEAGTLTKGINALMELVSGISIAFIGPGHLAAWMTALTQHELVEDPQDIVANALLHLAQGLSVSTQMFYAWYLASHGVVKLVLVIGLWRKKPWAYPASIAALAAFIVYQLYRYSFTQSPFLLALTVFDVLFMALVFNEYRIRRRNGA